MTDQRREGLRVVNREVVVKAPRSDVKVERAILANMLYSTELATETRRLGVAAHHFFSYENRVIYRALCRMLDAKIAIDMVMLESNLRSNGELREAGGESAVQDLFATIPSVESQPSYCRVLVQLFHERNREASAIEAVRLMGDGNIEEAQELLKKAAKPVDVGPKEERQPKPADPTRSVRADAQSLEPLTEAEYNTLVRTIHRVRVVNEAPELASYDEWVAALVYLAPFENGLELATELTVKSGFDDLDAAWGEAVALYGSADRAGSASIAQKIIEHLRSGGRDDIVPISHGFGIHNGAFVRRKLKYQDGEWVENQPEPLTNFTCWVVSQEFQDDGTGEPKRTIRMGGAFSWGEPLPEFTLPSEEWTNIGAWLHGAWGHKVIIFERRSNTGAVLEAIALYSLDAPVKHVYSHAGWIRTAGSNVFLTSSGPIGLDEAGRRAFEKSASIAIPNTFKNYKVPAECTHEQAVTGYRWLERYLNVADKSITAPIVAAMFLAPLASHLPLSFMLAICGESDSRKSSMVSAALACYGRDLWDSNNLPMSFEDTANSIVDQCFYGKDLPLVVDNFIPQKGPEHVKTLMRLAHSVGDNHGRRRMLDGHRSLQSKPVRGMMIITGEEQATHYSSAARMYVVSMMRSSVKLNELTEIQRAGMAGLLEPVMTHYIGWLSQKLEEPGFLAGIKSRWFDEARRLQAESKDHGRLAAQRVWISAGLELAVNSHPSGGWADPRVMVECTSQVNRAAIERGLNVREASITSRFFAAIKLLVDAGIAVGMDASTPNHPPAVYADAFGWAVNSVGIGTSRRFPDAQVALWIRYNHDGPADQEWYLYVNLELILHLLETKTRTPMAENARTIGAALEGEGILWVQPSAREAGKRSVAETLPHAGRQRVLRIVGSSFISHLGLDTKADE